MKTRRPAKRPAASPALKDERSHRLELKLNPYTDGSGYREIVIAEQRLDGTKEFVRQVTIKQGEQFLVLSPKDWLRLRGAVDNAIAIVFKGGKR